MIYTAFHKLSYGLYIISTQISGKKYGYIANTVFQVTSSPPRIAISCNKNNATADSIVHSGNFSISVLDKDASTSIIGSFGFMSSRDINKFSNIKTITGKTGAPIVTNSVIAWFDCKVYSISDIDSHLLIIGDVEESNLISDNPPLTYKYYREHYKMLSPKNSPTYINKDILEKEKNITSQKNKTEEIYTCSICGYQYIPENGDPSLGISPGTSFNDLSDSYHCPICNADKKYFIIK